MSDFYNILDYISEGNPGRVQSFLKEITDKMGLLSYYPNMGRYNEASSMRELVVHKNYIVHYRLFDQFVHIIRIRHAARDFFRS